MSLFRVTALLLAILPKAAWGFGDFHIRELSINYKRFHESSVIAEMAGYTPKESLALTLKTRVLGPLVWGTNVHGETDPGQYRLIGLQLHLGFDFHWIEFGYHHHSQHILDAHHPWLPRFPHEDAAYLNLYLIRD